MFVGMYCTHFFKHVIKSGHCIQRLSLGDDGLDGLGVAETCIWTRTCKRKYSASGRSVRPP